MSEFYGNDLAFIHDDGHGDYARRIAAPVLKLLRERGLTSGRVTDLGCGSGILAERLVADGYEVHGIDVSPAMIELSRKRVPRATFDVGSMYTAPIPESVAVTSLSECVNYLPPRSRKPNDLPKLFRHVYDALVPGGLLIFDAATTEHLRPRYQQPKFREGEDWAVLVNFAADTQRQQLTRRITSFRRSGDAYRRDAEVHRLQLYRPSEVARQLREARFRVRITRDPALCHSRAHAVYVAAK